MRRSPELAPLSRDHHVALAHSLRLRRVTDGELAEATARFLAFFVAEGRAHFAAEEEVLLPHMPPQQRQLAARLVDEHAEIRAAARAVARGPTVDAARRLGDLLAVHVRFEERELFPFLEATLAPAQLEDIGRRLDGHSAVREPDAEPDER